MTQLLSNYNKQLKQQEEIEEKEVKQMRKTYTKLSKQMYDR